LEDPVSGAALRAFLDRWGDIGREAGTLFRAKNGFYAYESSLLVRALHSNVQPLGVDEWNEPALWKTEYGIDLSATLFFAEDVFGNQFGLVSPGVVVVFDAETGEIEEMTRSVEDWAAAVIEDSDYRTGFPLAHEWQSRNGPLARGQRLLPKTPFVLGGQYSIDNLYALEDVEGMHFRATIAAQIRGVPDGSNVILETTKKGKKEPSSPS
jgi:hypothetical protein